MKRNHHKQATAAKTLAVATLASVLASPGAHAYNQISRAWQSNRSAAMGGVRMTTGLYEENFFGNPARVTANPETLVKLFQTGVEVSNISNVSTLVDKIQAGGQLVQSLGPAAGSNTHVRVQEMPFGVFIAPKEDRKWGLAIGLPIQIEANAILRQSYQVGAQLIVDTGPAVTFGYKLLEDKLSVGATSHVRARFSSVPNLTVAQLLQGNQLDLQKSVGQGMMLDFDLGATYELPILQETEFRMSVAAAINNILGGGYTNLGGTFVSSATCIPEGSTTAVACAPVRVARSLSVGTVLTRKIWGVFTDTSFAFEFTDFGNNSNNVYAGKAKDGGTDPTSTFYGSGSPFRLVHLGAETHWKVIALRAGLNQGYLAGGIGFDLRFFTLDFATYGEELGLNVGDLEDRRYALQIGFQI